MKRLTASVLIVLAVGMNLCAQEDADPPVIAAMEKLGTVYVTRKPASKLKTGDKGKSYITGVDFRPTAGSDPKKIAEAVKLLSALPELRTVLLLGKDVTDDAVAALPSGGRLTRVQFFNTAVTDKGVARLVSHQNLQEFNFTGSGLTDEGMKELAKIKTLQTIVIIDAKVTDAGVLALKTLPTLRRLTLENTEATERAINRLKEVLPRLIDGEQTLR